MSSSSRRPGPLKELALARFLPLQPGMVSNPFKCTPKRPRSPGAPIGLLSPAKKRILREDSLLAHPSPVKAPSRGSLLDMKPTIASPSRKLDFCHAISSPSSHLAEEDLQSRLSRTTRRSTTPNVNLSPSPELQQPHSGGGSSSSPVETLKEETQQTETSTSVVPFLIPRELPEVSDCQSIHYPGFDVHIDTHIELPSARRRVQLDPTTDLECTKENLPPRKRAKKSVLAPSELELFTKKLGVLDEEANFVEHGGTKHQRLPVTDKTPGRTPKPSHFARLASPSLTPGRTPTASRNAVLARRKAMEEEVDVPDDETSEETSDGAFTLHFTKYGEY